MEVESQEKGRGGKDERDKEEDKVRDDGRGELHKTKREQDINWSFYSDLLCAARSRPTVGHSAQPITSVSDGEHVALRPWPSSIVLFLLSLSS